MDWGKTANGEGKREGRSAEVRGMLAKRCLETRSEEMTALSNIRCFTEIDSARRTITTFEKKFVASSQKV